MFLPSLKGMVSEEYDSKGRLLGCQFNEENRIIIGENEFIPRYSQPVTRTKNRYALELFKSGAVKSIYLETACMIKAPFGKVQAEFITFTETGNMRRIFPTYGQISGFWSEEEEKELLPYSEIKVCETSYSGYFSCICLYPDGAIQSLTLWPSEIIKVPTKYGDIKTRYGVSFYKNGAIKSLEPAQAVCIKHKIGTLIAYHSQAVGITGDRNSLQFHETGELRSFYSTVTGIRCVHKRTGETIIIKPEFAWSKLDISVQVVPSVCYCFLEEGIQFTSSFLITSYYAYDEYEFEAFLVSEYLPYLACEDCSKCNRCK